VPTKPLSSPAAAAAATAAAEATAAAKAAPGTSYDAPPVRPAPAKPQPAKPEPAKPEPARPAPQPAQAAPTAPAAASGPWRAQFGAFGVEANARNLWASLEKKHPALAARQPYLVKSGNITRLQAGGFASKAEAEKLCATVRKDGQACLVVDK
jgi:cell division septation protein DedD